MRHYFSVPNKFGLDRWLIDYQGSGRSAGLRPIRDASRAIAMFSFSAAEVTNQDIGRMHVHSLSAPEPGAEPSPEADMEALTALIERAVGGPELPEYSYGHTLAGS